MEITYKNEISASFFEPQYVQCLFEKYSGSYQGIEAKCGLQGYCCQQISEQLTNRQQLK